MAGGRHDRTAPARYAVRIGSVPGIVVNRLGSIFDLTRNDLRVRHYSRRTEDCYVNWARRFIFFHRKRHPWTMSGTEVEQFLTHLAVNERVSASSQNQARGCHAHGLAWACE